MLTLILFLIVGSILAYVSQFNSELVTVNLGIMAFEDIPLFFVIIGSLVTGLVLAYAMHLVNMVSNSWAMRGKVNEIKKNKNEVLELTKRVHQLELENEKLKHSPKVEPVDHRSL